VAAPVASTFFFATGIAASVHAVAIGVTAFGALLAWGATKLIDRADQHRQVGDGAE